MNSNECNNNESDLISFTTKNFENDEKYKCNGFGSIGFEIVEIDVNSKIPFRQLSMRDQKWHWIIQ